MNMKLVLNINGKEITFSIDEAKMLYQELHEIFGAKPYTINIRNPEDYPPTVVPEPLGHWGLIQVNLLTKYN